MSPYKIRALLATVEPSKVVGQARKWPASGQPADLIELDNRIKAIVIQLTQVLTEHPTERSDLHGVGPAAAARVIAEVGDVRHPAAATSSPATAASHPWTPPRHRLNRGGSRACSVLGRVMGGRARCRPLPRSLLLTMTPIRAKVDWQPL